MTEGCGSSLSGQIDLLVFISVDFLGLGFNHSFDNLLLFTDHKLKLLKRSTLYHRLGGVVIAPEQTTVS